MSPDRSTTSKDWLLSEPSRVLFALCDPAQPKLHAYLDLLAHLFEADSVSLYSPVEGQISAVASAGINADSSNQALLQLAGQTIDANSGCCIINDSEQDSRFAGQDCPASMLAIPVHFGSDRHKVLGAITIGLARPSRFLNAEIATLERIARLLEMDIAGLSDVNRDPQTRLNSRAGFTNASKYVLELCQRIDHGAALVLFEATELDSVRQRFGAEFGDLLIRNLGALVYSTLRSSDVVGRLDDALIGALLPYNSNFDMTAVFKRFQQAIDNFNRSLAPGDGQPLAYKLAPSISYLPIVRGSELSVESLLANRQEFIALATPRAEAGTTA